MQHLQGDHFAGPQGGVRMFGKGLHVVIHLAEEGDDTIHGRHVRLHARQGCTVPTSLEQVHDHFNAANERYWFVRY